MASVDYRAQRTGVGPDTGRLDTDLTSLLPYVRWTPRPGQDVWALVGTGLGGMELANATTRLDTDLDMLLVAMGGRNQVNPWRALDLAVKADAFWVSLGADRHDRLPQVNGEAQRLRLLLEGRCDCWTVLQEQLSSSLEAGVRWDGGDAEQGLGIDLGGGLEYRHTRLGITVEWLMRYLLAHSQADFQDWGASLTLHVDPGVVRRGLWLKTAPVWGTPVSAAQSLWGAEQALATYGTSDAAARGWIPDQMEVEWGYGYTLAGRTGLFTPYGGLSLGNATHSYRLGWRVDLDEEGTLSLEAEREEQNGSRPAHGVSLQGRLRW